MIFNIEYLPLSSMVEINPPVQTNHLKSGHLVSFIPMSDVSETGQWIHQQERELRGVLGHGYTAFQEGDILFAKITPCMENGKGTHAINLVNGIGFGTTEFHVLRAKPPAIARFIYHLLHSEQLRRKAEALMIGSAGQRRVSQGFFKLYNIPSFLPLEQQRIADILDTIDEQIQCTEQLVTKLKYQRSGLLHDLLTRGIDEYGQLRDPVAHPEQFKDELLGKILVKVPKEWEITVLGNVVLRNGGVIQTGPFGTQLHASEYVSEGVPVIMPQDIRGECIDQSQIVHIMITKAEALARHKVEFNDVVFARRGSLDRCAFIDTLDIDSICGTDCLLVRSPKKLIDGRWLAAIYRHYYSQQQIRALAVGSTMMGLNTKLLAKLVIAKPPLEEQVSIMNQISSVDSLIYIEEAYCDKLKLYKRGLMDDLLTGRVRFNMYNKENLVQILQGEKIVIT